MMKISVQDTGQGIPEEDLARVFQAFERTRAGKIKQGQSGAGLGLALVKNLTELHQGSVNIQSIEGKGTTVSLLFPLQ
jgi:signal transduction histidine kinase